MHVAHAAQAVAAGKCRVALITLAGRPRSETRTPLAANVPEVPFEAAYGAITLNMYAMVAARHMHEFGTTPEQLAWVKVAMSHHTQHNRTPCCATW